MKTILTSGLDALGISYTENAVDNLITYYEMLVETNKVMILTAITEAEVVAK